MKKDSTCACKMGITLMCEQVINLTVGGKKHKQVINLMRKLVTKKEVII